MKKPKIITKCVANHYAMNNERIIEFSNGTTGGLISICNIEGCTGEPDTIRIYVYSCDPGVTIVPGEGTTTSTNRT